METTTKTTKTTTTTAGGVGKTERDLGDTTRSLGTKIKEVAADLKNTFVESLPNKHSFERDPTGSDRDLSKDHYRHEKKTEVIDPITGVRTESVEKTEKVTK